MAQPILVVLLLHLLLPLLVLVLLFLPSFPFSFIWEIEGPIQRPSRLVKSTRSLLFATEVT